MSNSDVNCRHDNACPTSTRYASVKASTPVSDAMATPLPPPAAPAPPVSAARPPSVEAGRPRAAALSVPSMLRQGFGIRPAPTSLSATDRSAANFNSSRKKNSQQQPNDVKHVVERRHPQQLARHIVLCIAHQSGKGVPWVKTRGLT